MWPVATESGSFGTSFTSRKERTCALGGTEWLLVVPGELEMGPQITQQGHD